MKKLMMAIVCLMTTVISVNAQSEYDEKIWFGLYAKYDGNKIFSFSSFNIYSRNNLTLYQGTVDEMTKIFTKILNKSREWNKICVEDKAPSIEKKIGKYGDFYAFFSYKDYSKNYDVIFCPKDEYEEHKRLPIYSPKGFICLENDLIYIISRLGEIDVDRYVERDIKKEEMRKFWQEEEERKKTILRKLN
jgi:hypothetical protein